MTRPISRRGLVLGAASAAVTLSRSGHAAQATGAPIVCWGDSLTFGTGASTIANRYPNVLAASFTPPRTVFPGGVGGDSSVEIATRMLADEAHRGWVAVIWAGRNNYDSGERVRSDIAAMVAHLTSRRFAVLSILNADVPEEQRGEPGYRAIMALNATLKQTYGPHYLDVREPLVLDGLHQASLPATPKDIQNITADVPPASLRADHIHLNDAGQAVVAHEVQKFIQRQGW